MRVILKQNVENLGSKGDIVNVAPGYGRNYLIPKKIALEVTSSNVKMIEIEQQALKKAAEKERASYQGVIEKLNETTLIFKRKAGEKDVIFGSVSSGDVREALHELGFEIDKKKILLDEPIKRLGNFTVPIKIYHEDRAEVKVEVVTEKGEKAVEERPEEEEVKAAPEEEQTEDTVETQEEKEVDTKKAKKKKKAKEADAVPVREEEEAKVEEKEEEDDIFGDKKEKKKNKREAEGVKEEAAKEQEEAADAKAEEVKEKAPTAEGKKGKAKKEKKKKKKEK